MMAEQYVCQQLVGECGLDPFYWSAKGTPAEVDFCVQVGGEVYPIEVKAEENLRSKSLRAFQERYGPVRCVRFSLSGFKDQGWLVNVPLWAMGHMGFWTTDP